MPAPVTRPTCARHAAGSTSWLTRAMPRLWTWRATTPPAWCGRAWSATWPSAGPSPETAGIVMPRGSSCSASRATSAARRALRALDELLRRTYARNRGARHTPGGAGVHGLLQDQVQVAGACLAAYGYQGARRYLDVAADLAHVLDRDFADSVGGGYFDAVLTDPVPPAVADRGKPVLDDLLPGANAWAAHVLLQLAEATGDARYRRRAEATLEAFAGALAGDDVRASSYLLVAQHALVAR